MNDNRKSYYSLLGVQPDATPDEIRNAYRKLAKRYHPDRNPGDKKAETQFKLLGDAYRALTDPNSRLLYHQKEEVRTKAKTAEKGKQTSSFSDVFKQVFKSGFGSAESISEPSQNPRPGKDLKITLELDTFELLAGAKRTLKVKKDVRCGVCGGSGVKPGHGMQECTICQGLGEVPKSQGGKTVFVTCTNCMGTGSIIKERCLACGGRSIIRSTENVTLDVPPKSAAGSTIMIKEKGNAGLFRGRPGNLLVELVEKNSSYLKREGDDLLYDCPLSILEVMAGGEIEVPTPRGKVKLNLYPGIAPGTILKVAGKGLPKSDGGEGDLKVRIRYHVPSELTGRARKVLESLVKLPEWTPPRDEKGFVKRDSKK